MPALLRLWLHQLFSLEGQPPAAATKPGPMPLRLDELESRIACATFTVTRTGDSAAAGSLRSAIEAADLAAGDDVIHVPAGTYKLTRGQLSVDSNLSILAVSGPVIIDAQGASRVVEVAAETTVRFVGLTLQNGLFRNAGGEQAGGGGIFNQGDLTLERCVITANKARGMATEYGGTAAFGGGIFNLGTLRIANSLISANLAQGAKGPTGEYGGSGANAYGGGIYSTVADSTTALELVNATLSNNTVTGGVATGSEYGGSAFGGGLYVSGNDVLIQNTTISGNKATGGAGGSGQDYGGAGGAALGGGVYFADGVLRVEASTFASNSAIGGPSGSAATPSEYGGRAVGGTGHGGGIFASVAGVGDEYGGDLVITNSTFSANKAKGGVGQDYGGSGLGGAIYLSDGANDDAAITNTTIAFNEVTAGDNQEYGGVARGSGIFNEDGAAGVPVRNSIIAKNKGAPDVSGDFTSLQDNLIGKVAHSTGFGAGDLIGVDPKLGPLANNGGFTMTHALLSGSPARNAVDAGATARDQRGAVRPAGLKADIGAFEAGAATVDLKVTNKATLQGAGTSSTADDFVVYVIAIKNVGTTAATGVTLIDTLSPDVTFDSATSTRGTPTYDNGVMTCDVGAVAAGATVTITVKAKPPAAKTWVANVAAAFALEGESTPKDNSRTKWIQAGG